MSRLVGLLIFAVLFISIMIMLHFLLEESSRQTCFEHPAVAGCERFLEKGEA